MNYLGDVAVAATASVTDRWLGGIRSIHNPFASPGERKGIITAEETQPGDAFSSAQGSERHERQRASGG